MALNTTPEETTAIHNHAALAARDIASKWIRNTDGYRNTNERFRDSVRAALAVVSAEVSVPALEVNRYLASAWADMNPYTSDYDKLSRTIEAEILGYAIEAQEQETSELFEEVSA
jgi:hypothetical protein